MNAQILYWLFIGACVGGFGAFVGGYCLQRYRPPYVRPRFTKKVMGCWMLVCALISASVAAFSVGSASTVNVAMLLAVIGLSAFAQDIPFVVMCLFFKHGRRG